MNLEKHGNTKYGICSTPCPRFTQGKGIEPSHSHTTVLTKLYHAIPWQSYTIPYHNMVIPYHGINKVIPYHTMTKLYHTIPWHGYTIPYHNMINHTMSYHTMVLTKLYHTMSYQTMSDDTMVLTKLYHTKYDSYRQTTIP